MSREAYWIRQAEKRWVNFHRRAELAHPLAPLGGAVVVVHLLAGANQVAAGGADHRGVAELAGGRGGGGLVQPAHARGHLALGDQSQSLEGDAEHLHVRRSHRARDGGGLCAQSPGGHGVALAHEGDMRLLIGQQRVLGGGRQAVQQTLGALDPAVGDGGFTPEVGVVVGEPDGDPGGGATVISLAEQPVGALPGIDPGGVVLQPPTGHAESFERFGRLGVLEGALEADARFLPAAAGEGVAAGLEPVGGEESSVVDVPVLCGWVML